MVPLARSNGKKRTLQSISIKPRGAQVRSQNTGPEEDRTIPSRDPKPQHSPTLAGHAPASWRCEPSLPCEHTVSLSGVSANHQALHLGKPSLKAASFPSLSDQTSGTIPLGAQGF